MQTKLLLFKKTLKEKIVAKLLDFVKTFLLELSTPEDYRSLAKLFLI